MLQKTLKTLLTILTISISFQVQADTVSETFTTADGAGMDIYIKPGMTNRQGTLQVKNAERAGGDPHVTTKTYLKFDISGFSDRLDDIEGAGLQLTVSRNTLSGDGPPAEMQVFVYGLTDESLDNWDETEVIWESAPGNDITSNGLDMEKVVALGQMDIPATSAPQVVSYMSAELASFVATDTNGVVTLILLRQDTDAAQNLWFDSKEDAGGNTSDMPTLELVLFDDPDAIVPFDRVVDGENFRADYYESPWFGRFEYTSDDGIVTNGLGRLWAGAINNSSNMFMWSWGLNQWIWTSESYYPYVYLLGEGDWSYVLSDRTFGTYVWRYNAAEWTHMDQTGWEYPLTNAELMEGLNEKIAAAPHPRILLNLDDIDLLREKVSDGWLGAAYEKTKSAMRRRVILNDYRLDYKPTMGREMQDVIASAALVGYIEDDPAYHRLGIDYTLRQIETFSYDELELNNAGSPHLGTGDVLHAFAIAYDWLYPSMTEPERSAIRTVLEELGARQLENTKQNYSGNSPPNSSSNHNGVANGGLGLTAMALGNQPVWLDQAISLIRNYLELSTDDDGWNFEGAHYFGYGGWGAFAFASALERVGGPDLLDEQPKYDSVAVDYFLRRASPYGKIGGIAAAMPFIAQTQDRVGLWLFLHTNGEDGDGTYGSVGSDISFLPYTFIWADPDLEPLEPINADLPLDKVFPSDRAIFRDGWGPMDTMVSMTAAWTRHSGHRVRRDNSFQFHALGENFAIAPSDASTRMEVLENLVMVNEPRRTRNASEYPYGATFESVVTEDDYAYIRSDATTSVVYYDNPTGWTTPDNRKVTEAVRHLLFARSPEGVGEPYLVIIDDLTARDSTATFSWLLQTAAQNTVDLGDADNSFQITGKNHGNLLDVEFLSPDDLTNDFVSHEGRDEIKGRWSDDRINSTLTTISTSTDAKSVRFIALLRAHAAETSPPAYTFTGTETNGEIVVTLSDGTVDTITIDGDIVTFARTPPPG
jgi:hypothetical protein